MALMPIEIHQYRLDQTPTGHQWRVVVLTPLPYRMTAPYGWGSNGGGQFGINTNTERGGRPEQENARSVLSPFLVDLDGNSDQPFLVENWLSVIPHKVFNYDYDYYYTYTYDYVNGNYYRVKPTTSSTIALATVKPNQKS